jgi:hypothetical protein
VRQKLQPFRPYSVFIIGEPSSIAAGPCQALDKASANRIGDDNKHNWQRPVQPEERSHRTRTSSQDDIGRKRNQFRGVLADAICISSPPTIFNLYVSANGPSSLLQTLNECGVTNLSFGIV